MLSRPREARKILKHPLVYSRTPPRPPVANAVCRDARATSSEVGGAKFPPAVACESCGALALRDALAQLVPQATARVCVAAAAQGALRGSWRQNLGRVCWRSPSTQLPWAARLRVSLFSPSQAPLGAVCAHRLACGNSARPAVGSALGTGTLQAAAASGNWRRALLHLRAQTQQQGSHKKLRFPPAPPPRRQTGVLPAYKFSRSTWVWRLESGHPLILSSCRCGGGPRRQACRWLGARMGGGWLGGWLVLKNLYSPEPNFQPRPVLPERCEKSGGWPCLAARFATAKRWLAAAGVEFALCFVQNG